MPMEKTTREKLEGITDGLRAERRPYEPDWEEISRLASPRSINIVRQNNSTNRRASNRTLHDSGGLLSGRTTTNGMATGMSPSARPWFKLAVRDRDMMEWGPVKEWLGYVEQVIGGIFQATNYYDTAKLQ